MQEARVAAGGLGCGRHDQGGERLTAALGKLGF